MSRRWNWSFSVVFIASLAAFVLSPSANAADGTLTITAPTQRVDGSALPANQIAGYDAECSAFTPTGGTAGTCPIASGSTTTTSVTLTGTIPAVGGTACFRVRTRDTGGLLSAWTNPVCKTFAANPPNPPGNVTVAVVIDMTFTPVYSVTSTGKLSTLMGFIATGKPCADPVLATYRGSPFHEVQRADVLMWGKTSLRLAAPCSG